MKLHIARVAKTLPPILGGLERHALRLSQEQARRHRVTVLFVRGKSAPARNLTFHRLLVPFWGDRYLTQALATDWAALRQLERLHRKHPFDIVHAHGDFIEAALLSRFAHTARIPLILTLHALIVPTFEPLWRWTYGKVDRFICVGNDIKDRLIHLGIPSDKVSVISSGIDYHEIVLATRGSHQATRKKFGLEDWQPIIFFAGRLVPMKGVEYLLSALPHIQKRLPGAGVLIAGDGPGRAGLEQSARLLRRVRFIGHVDQKMLARLMGAADLFVLPSVTLERTAEGVSTAVMQAMAAGLPIVSTRTGSMADVVTEKSGLLVPERDPEAIAQACVTLLTDPKRRRAIRSYNQRWASQKDWSVIANQVEEVYKTLLGVSCASSSSLRH